MKKVLKSIITFAVAALVISSCTITKPYAATDNPIGTKVGKSNNSCLFSSVNGSVKSGISRLSAAGLCFNNNNYGIQQAAKAGGINKVGAVDITITNYVLFKKFTLTAYGE